MNKIDMNAIQFLEWLQPEGPWHLISIHPNGKVDTESFDTKELSHAENTIHNWAKTLNVYFTVNQAFAEFDSNTGRVKKEHVKNALCCHLDIDPPSDVKPEDYEMWRGAAADRLLYDRPKGVPTPSAILKSGNGLQVFWRLKEPTTDLEKVEEINKALISKFKGDPSTFHRAQILRLPGTTNHPNKKKLKLGRTAQPVALVHFDRENVVSLATFEQLRQEMAGRIEKTRATEVELPPLGDMVKTDDLADLQAKYPDVRDRVWVIVNNGRHPSEPPKESDNSRSAWVYDASCNLLRGGVPPEVVLGLFMDPDFGISESILEAGTSSESYARRQVRRGQETIVQDAAKLKFICDENGKPYKKLLHNHLVAIHKIGVSVKKDLFNDYYLIAGLSDFEGRVTDAAVTRMRFFIESRYGFTIGKEAMRDMICDIGENNRFHPVCDYLDGLHWDGVVRLDTWLSRYLGVEDNIYTRAVGRLLLTAAVRRVREPGCKFDEMVVLEGQTGGGKSTALRIMSVHDNWFTDELPLGANGKEVMEATLGKWIVEAAELVGMTKRSAEQMKSMLSRTFDKGRAAYGYFSDQRDRQFVICGTTNHDRYLKDTTGNRRFWPVVCGEIDLKALRTDRDQLWAEAAISEAERVSIRLDPALYELAAGEQAKREEENPMEALFADKLGAFHGRIQISQMYDLLGVPKTQLSMSLIGQAAHSLGWERKQLKYEGVQTRCYVRGDKIQSQVELETRRDKDGIWFVEAKAQPEADLPF